MRLFLSAVVVAGLGGVCGSACASSIPAGTYDVSGLAADGYQFAGSVTLDGSGIVDAAQIELEDAALGDPMFTEINSAGGPAGYAPMANYAFLTDPGVGQLEIQYLTSEDGAGDVDVCTLSAHDCNGYQASYVQIYESSSFGYGLTALNGTGQLEAAVSAPPGATPVDPGSSSDSSESAVTPEPATLALLGTGILTLAWMTRKRKRY